MQRTLAYRAVSASTPTEVRAILREMLSHWNQDGLIDDMTFVATELVTNVAQHAQGNCTVRVELGEDTVQLTVQDCSPLVPVIPASQPPLDADCGRGLWSVKACCQRFHFDACECGKIAVAEFPAAA